MTAEDNFPELATDDASWHVLRLNERSGPHQLSDLLLAISEGVIKGRDLIWRPGWSDWREVRSIASHLSASLDGMFDCEEPVLSVAAAAPSILVHKLELKLRPTELKQSRFEQLQQHNRIPLALNLALISFAVFALLILSTLIYGNSREGLLYTGLEFATLLAIGFGLMRQLEVIRFSPFHSAAAPAMAGLLLIAANGYRLPDAFDVWQGKRLVSNLHTMKDIQHIAREHPKSKFIALLLASHDAVRESTIAVRQLIDSFPAKGITLDVVLATSTRDKLTQQAEELRAAEARAILAWSDYLQILENERSVVERVGREIYPGDPLHVLPKVMQVLANRQELLREHMDKKFKAIAALHSAKGDLAEFMASHFEQSRGLRLPGVQTTFVDQATSDQLKRLAANVRAAQTNLAGFDRDNRIVNAEQNGLRLVVASAI
jgi:hypothetical protein